MKKILSTIAMALVAMTMNAQSLVEFADFQQGSNPLKWEAEGITVTAVDDKAKMTATSGVRKFEDGQRFTTRLKTGGKSAKANSITVNVKKPGKLTVYAASGSSQNGRTLVFMQDGKVVVTQNMDNQNKIPVSADVKAGNVEVMYYDGAMSIYGVKFEAAE